MYAVFFIVYSGFFLYFRCFLIYFIINISIETIYFFFFSWLLSSGAYPVLPRTIRRGSYSIW